jgi:hypothetical protein
LETPARRQERPIYQEYDMIPFPGDIPQLGVKKGEEGVIEDLSYRNNTVEASVRVYHSTRQSKGLVGMRIRPDEEILSYSPEVAT